MTLYALIPLKANPDLSTPAIIAFFRPSPSPTSITGIIHSQIASFKARGLSPPDPTRPEDIPIHALAVGRAISYVESRQRLIEQNHRPERFHRLPPTVSYTGTIGTTAMFLYLSFGMPAPPGALTDPRGIPICYVGPGCHSLAAESTERRASPIFLLQAGIRSFYHPPFRLPPIDPTAVHPPVPPSHDIPAYACELCPSPSPGLSYPVEPHHFVVGCKSASVQLAREAAIAKLPSIIQPFLATAHKLNKPPTSPDAPPPPLLGLPATTIEILKNFPTSWEAATQKERDTILYHLVLSSPWPPSATPDEWHLAKALALAFEKIYITVGPGSRLADKLVPWALATINALQVAREADFHTLHRPPTQPQTT